VTAALAIAGNRLYAAFRTGDRDLLRNSGETVNAPFKTGGALDLMLGVGEESDGDCGRCPFGSGTDPSAMGNMAV
jgi:hypothetical protein